MAAVSMIEVTANDRLGGKGQFLSATNLDLC